MNTKLLHRIFAAVVFLITLFVYLSTVQPSVSFWDCGEFIASSFYLQVPHPPGAPFFLLLNNILSKIPIVQNTGLRVNLISVLSSALACMFLYLSAVRLINNYKGKKPENLFEGFATYLAAAIGALSLCFSDTFWFNGVEAEVYAFSTMLVAAITYLILRWHEKADDKDSEKYILMIAYLIGLSTGVHLMSVLTIVPVAMIIIFRKYVKDEEALKKTGMIFLAHAAILVIISLIWWAGEHTSSAPSPDEYKDFDIKFKIMALIVSMLIMGVFWKKVFTKNSFYFPLIVGGVALFATYPGVVKFVPKIITGVAGDDLTMEIIVLVLMFGLLAYGVYYAMKNNKPTLHMISMSAIFILVGFTTFAMVIIRANQDPPMNENEPKTFPDLEKYLNREQYGDFPTFKRRYATEPHQMGVYSNYSSDLDFFYVYQMNHMMTRYWLWNYAGREGWEQDDGADVAPFNGVANIIGKVIAVNFAGEWKDSLFGIPFLIGLLGIYFHFRKDWKMASIFMVMFILMGYLTAFYQNQQEPQPRERDYFYVGAFFVFSIWIGIGVRGLVDLVQEKIKNKSTRNASVVAVLIFSFILIPFRMMQANYFTHDRSKNWVPWDYSYNILQSCAPHSILFTNGDNDTFPLWYLQDVEGVRRDIKIVNLSLLNTPWYVRQLKNNDPYGVGTVRIRIPDERINDDDLRPVQLQKPVALTISVPKTNSQADLDSIYKEYAISDSSVMKSGNLTWTMTNTLTVGTIKAIRVQDIMVREIVEANNWERPVYFAVTCSDDSRIGLGDYMKMEGMAFRLVPEKRNASREFINKDIVEKQITENPGYSKDYMPGFKFRGLNDPDIFFDNNQSRMVQNYRNAFLRLAVYYRSLNKNDKVVEVMDKMNDKLPYKILGIDNGLLFEISSLYLDSGAKEKYKQLAADVEKQALQDIDRNPTDVNSYHNPYRMLIEIYENLKEYDKLLGVWEKLETMFPNDPTVKSNLAKYRQMLHRNDSTAVMPDSTK
jgi:Protein O-mannosyl-transferase TMEM260-like